METHCNVSLVRLPVPTSGILVYLKIAEIQAVQEMIKYFPFFVVDVMRFHGSFHLSLIPFSQLLCVLLSISRYHEVVTCSNW